MIAVQHSRRSEITDPYQKSFERFAQSSSPDNPSWLIPVRKAAMARFAESGWPTLRDEDWRYTNIAPISSLAFNPILEESKHSLSVQTLRQFPLTQADGYRLVFVNGRYAEDLSSTPPENSGIQIQSLAKALREDSPLLESHLNRQAPVAESAFVALNTAFFQDGALISASAGAQVEAPILLLFISIATAAGNVSHPRNLIIAEKGAKLTVIESYVRASDVPHLTNTISELVIGEAAVVEFCKFQDESPHAFHVAGIHAHLSRNSKLTAHSIATGGRIARNNIRVKLDGEGINCTLNGLYLTRDEQLCDHHMIVEHAKPHCNSHEYFNGILDGRSRGVFHGRILVRPEAQKTDAKQTNKNLLLSDDATANTKPQLEIYADDVKCTHGATIGQLNEDSIFYLRARGIGLETARRMLIHAFAGEIIDHVNCNSARVELDRLIWDRLEQSPRVAERR